MFQVRARDVMSCLANVPASGLANQADPDTDTLTLLLTRQLERAELSVRVL
jgi:hypothetical protein